MPFNDWQVIMTHQWHDSFQHQRTPAHHLDPRSKLFVGLLFIVVVLLTPQFTRVQTAGYTAFLLAAVMFSGVSIKHLFTRFLVIVPFALLMCLSVWFSHLPLDRMFSVLGKALCSIAAMTLLISTTPFPDMLRALEQLHLPRLLIMFLGFLYRYGQVLYAEALQLERAWTARYFGRYWVRQWIHLGHVLASLFIRSYERAERVFAAMQARGFSSGASGVNLLHFGMGDVVFVVSSTLILGLIQWGRM
jgi:cobalt/nickel transport system permease protein